MQAPYAQQDEITSFISSASFTSSEGSLNCQRGCVDPNDPAEIFFAIAIEPCRMCDTLHGI
jgi:hypothetical protein